LSPRTRNTSRAQLKYGFPVFITFFHTFLSRPQLFATYLQIQETIGNVTGNEAWKSSGTQDKSQAVDAMKSASANRDPNTQGYGGIEEKAGSLVGCEGMQKEGAESKKQ
jgi:uncharacterized protein YjbJ (UPF0337 family)